MFEVRSLFRSLAVLPIIGLLAEIAISGKIFAEIIPDNSLPAFVRESRPPRLGYWSLNRQMDVVRPLAAMDSAGFVFNSGMFIGAVDQRWVVGMSWATKQDIWWLEGGSTMTAPPGSFGSHVVLGFKDGTIKKVEALTGKVVWQARLDSFTERGFVLSGTRLYVLTAAQILHAIDFQSGQIQWVYDGGFPEGLTIRGRSKPLVHDGRIYFGVSSGEIICLEAESGKLDWKQNPDFLDGQFHDFVGEFYVRDQLLFFARYDGLVGALSLKGPSRSLVWKEELSALTAMLVRGPRLYVGGANGDIVAKNISNISPDGNKKSGEKDLWRYSTGLAISTFTLTEDLIIATSVEGRITALSTLQGQLHWHDDLQGSLVTSPILIDQGLYFLTGLKGMYGYQLTRGTLGRP